EQLGRSSRFASRLRCCPFMVQLDTAFLCNALRASLLRLIGNRRKGLRTVFTLQGDGIQPPQRCWRVHVQTVRASPCGCRRDRLVAASRNGTGSVQVCDEPTVVSDAVVRLDSYRRFSRCQVIVRSFPPTWSPSS